MVMLISETVELRRRMRLSLDLLSSSHLGHSQMEMFQSSTFSIKLALKCCTTPGKICRSLVKKPQGHDCIAMLFWMKGH